MTVLQAWSSSDGAYARRRSRTDRPIIPNPADTLTQVRLYRAALKALPVDIQVRLYRVGLLNPGGTDVPLPLDRPARSSEIVWYEDLYVAGDSVTSAMARLTQPKKISFPVGKFEEADFSHALANIEIPKVCRGIIGSGQGDYTGTTDGTYFSMKPMSSTKQANVPAQDNSTPVQMRLMRHIGARDFFPEIPLEYANFRVLGTDQGHIYHGFTIYNPPHRCWVHDFACGGTFGNNGAPPGETFSFELHEGNNHLMERVDLDGRRPDGQAYSAVGSTVANTVGSVISDSHFHHNRGSQFVLFQSFNVTTENLLCERPFIEPQALNKNSVGINHERTAGITHINLDIRNIRQDGTGVHLNFSNDSWSANYDGTLRTVANGKLTVIDPKFAPIYNDRMYIQSWTPYWTGDSMTLAGAPTVQRADGTHIPYTWVHGTHNLIT